MQSSVFTAVLLPMVLASIMFGMGLSLQREDFARLVKVPKPIFIGLFGQLLLLPALAFSIAVLTNASEEVAIGLMILSVCPGGTTSNLFAHLARANLALSISLTAITTIVCVFTTPLMIAFSIDYFSESTPAPFSLLSTSLGLIVISLIPVLLGMYVRAHFIDFALKAEPLFRKLAIVFMILLIVKISYDEREMIVAGFPDMYIVALSLNILATLLGVFLAKLFILGKRDGITLGIEIGTQNATLAILIALSFVKIPAYAVIPGIYGLLMYVGASLLVLYSKSKRAA